MRTIESHKVNPINDTLTITVADDPGEGGANHAYVVSGFDSSQNGSIGAAEKVGNVGDAVILFQRGPIADYGVNGLTHEVLLAIVADRLEMFQGGPYANDYNAEALDFVRKAQERLQARTKERMARGVEGTMKQ